MLGSLVGVLEDHLGLLMRIVAADRMLLRKQLLPTSDPCLIGGLSHLSTVPMLWVKEVPSSPADLARFLRHLPRYAGQDGTCLARQDQQEEPGHNDRDEQRRKAAHTVTEEEEHGSIHLLWSWAHLAWRQAAVG